jgi:hypothetical protein
MGFGGRKSRKTLCQMSTKLERAAIPTAVAKTTNSGFKASELNEL